MKFTGHRARLLEAFNVVASVVSPRAIKPILQNLRMIVDAEGATLMATDLEVSIRYKVPLEVVEEGGDVVVPVGRLHGILREATSDRVVVSSNDRKLSVRCGGSSFTIHGEDPDEFPTIAAFEAQRSVLIPSRIFRAMVRKTHFAAAKERGRFAFNGVRLQIDKGADEVRMIATDGKRMAVMMSPIDNPDGVIAGHIIPTKGLLTFDKVLDDGESTAPLPTVAVDGAKASGKPAGKGKAAEAFEPTVRVAVDEKQVMIQTSRAEVASRIVEGAFPKYETVIPEEKALVASASFDREALIATLRQAKLFTNEESRSVRFSFEADRLVLRSRAMDVGEAEVQVPTTLEGKPLETAFNPDFVLEGLAATDSPTVRLRLSGRDTPAKIDGEERYQYVVMPVTVRSA